VSAFGPVRFESGAPMLVAGLRRRHDLRTAEATLARQWQDVAVLPALSALGSGGVRYGVTCGADATGFEYLAGVEVATFDGLPEGTARIRVPAQRYAVFALDRRISTLRDAWQAILGWLASGTYASAEKPDFERYGPGCDPIGGREPIEIFVGVVSRGRFPALPNDERA